MKYKEPIISVIVPVYNAEIYLKKCLDSILNQIFNDFELIIINDGSTDGSALICDEYAQKDARVRVFHKENGGVSSARSLGFRMMNGKYSIHVDSDDWVEPAYLKDLYSCAKVENADIVWCDFNEVTSDSVVHSSQKSTNRIDCIRNLLVGKMHGSLCNKLIRNSILSKNRIELIEGVDLWEDLYLSILTFYYSTNIFYLNKALYNYNVNIASSITDNIPMSLEKIMMKVKVAVKLEELLMSRESIFVKEYLSLRLRAKSDLVLFKYNFNIWLWNNLIPTSLPNILRSYNPLRLKLLFVCAKLRMDLVLKFYISVRNMKYSIKTK